MRKGWIHQQDITTITSTESPSRAEAGEASVRSAGLGKWHKEWRRGKGKRDPGVKWDWAAGGDRTRRVLWAQWGTPTFTRRVKAFYPHVLCVLSPSVVSNSLWPYGLSLARLLCPWGVSRQEYWSGLPCLPLYPHTYSQLIFNRSESIRWGKDSLFSKWHWESQKAAYKSMKSEHSLTPYTKINSQWLKGFNIKIWHHKTPTRDHRQNIH